MKKKYGVCAAMAILLAAAARADEPLYYSIKLGDKLIGYAVTSTERVTQDGRELLRVKSRTTLKVAVLGKERLTVLDSTTDFTADARGLVAHRMTGKTNDVVHHVEAEFNGATARTWIYQEGDPRGDPVATDLPDGTVILGGNNFAHWKLLIKSAASRAEDGKATVPIFLPDVRQVDQFELLRGDETTAVVAGKNRECVSWRSEKANLLVLVDAETGSLVRMELPSQQSTIEMVDESVVKLAEKSRAEEVLTRHFTQSNVLFDDLLAVRQMSAKIDVRVIGVENEASILTSGIQQFDGSKDSDHIVGTVGIRTIQYALENSPAFPAERDAEFANWLEPSTYIESDYTSIVEKSAELTREATTRWDAVERIGQWVYQEISYTIADTPSARLALEKKTGDCGPHSTLMVAMLRAAGIPARLVGGLVYTPTFGGSFGQHAWVEVHMGDAGWMAVDPTTGEFEQLSATHIKLFEGLGGVIPESVEVVSFEPPNRKAALAVTRAPRPLAWKLDKEYKFKYLKAGKEIGQETFSITRVESGGKDAFKLTSDLKIKTGPLTSLTSDTTLTVRLNAQPLSFMRNLSALLQKTTIECTFEGRVVKEEVSGSTSLSREITLPDGTYCFDNNLMGCFVLICSQLQLEAGKAIKINTFHPSSLQIIPLTLTPKPPATISIGDEEIECFECEVAPIKNTFWISRDGRFVRAGQGDVVIELITP